MWISVISCQVIVSSEIIGRGRCTGTDYRDVSSFGLESHDDHHPSVLSQGNAHRGHSRKKIWHLLRVVAIIFSLFISLSFFHMSMCLCCLHRCGACVRGDQKLTSDVFLDSSSLYLPNHRLLLNFALPDSASSDEYLAPVPLFLPLEH